MAWRGSFDLLNASRIRAREAATMNPIRVHFGPMSEMLRAILRRLSGLKSASGRQASAAEPPASLSDTN